MGTTKTSAWVHCINTSAVPAKHHTFRLELSFLFLERLDESIAEVFRASSKTPHFTVPRLNFFSKLRSDAIIQTLRIQDTQE